MGRFVITYVEKIETPIIGEDVVHQHYANQVHPDYEEVVAGQYGTWNGEGGVNVEVRIADLGHDHTFAPTNAVAKG